VGHGSGGASNAQAQPRALACRLRCLVGRKETLHDCLHRDGRADSGIIVADDPAAAVHAALDAARRAGA
jgi:hypothetical protein